MTAFESGRKFIDKKNFPYGFARSGEFTLQQAQLLERHGYAYSELASGQRAPVDPVEEAFVRFCHAEKEATNEHEKVWQRYMSKTSVRPFYSIAVGLSARNSEDSEPLDLDDD